MNTDNLSLNSAVLFRRINTITFVLIGANLLLCVIILIIRAGTGLRDITASGQMIENLILIMIILFITGGYFLYVRGTRRITDQTPLDIKLQTFFRFSLFKLVFFSVAGFFSLIGYLMTGVTLYLVIFAVSVMLIFLHKPSSSKLVVEFRLTSEERKIIGL
jgi:hypothetical protein